MLAATSFGVDAAVHGVILGLVYGVLAVGLVLVYRASGVVNFAHGEVGAFCAAVLAKLVLDEHWPFVVALGPVLAIGGLIGALTERLIARRLRNRPKLALLVATIGLSQLLLVGELVLPAIKEVAPFPAPIHRQLSIGSVTLTGADFLAIAAVPAMVVGLAVWLARTPTGRALRAAADNPDAARLAGIRPERVAMLAWVLAGVVSAATAVIADPLQGVVVGQQTQAIGAGLLVRALVAALVGRLQSLPLALAGGVGVGLVQAAADAGRISQSAVDVVLLVAALGLVLARGSGADGSAPGEGTLVRVPAVRRRPPWAAMGVGFAVAAVAVPLVAARSSELFSLSRVALYAVVGLSVVVLTGWTGQLSLGQFAVVGIGTFGAAALENHGVPFWGAVLLAGGLGAAVSAVVGLPALRVRGLDLAITTLALAVACSSWLFTQAWILGPGGVVLVTRGKLLGLDLRGPLAYYECCVIVLAVALGSAAAVRRGDLGRRWLAVRANERRAAAAGVSPVAAKMAAFAVSGILAGVAGALLAGLRTRTGAADFGPQESLQVVALAVIGGAGSVSGALAGAVFVLGVPAIFGDTTVAGLLPTGLGLLVLVLVFPGGLVEFGHRIVARVRKAPPAAGVAEPSPGTDRSSEVVRTAPPSAVEVVGLTVHYGGRLALDTVDLRVAPGEVLGLIGANGAGKSTLLDVLSGFVGASAGRVEVDGVDIGGLSPAARVSRAGLGRVLQDARLFDDLTLEEAVEVASRRPRHRRRAVAGATLELLGLDPYASTVCQELSTGVRRLAELACALAGSPTVLLLDEPTAGLAQAEAEAFGPLLRRLHDELGVTIVLVEHDVALVMAAADRMVCLGAGRVLATGTPTEVVNHPEVVTSFLGGDPRAVRRSGSR